MKKSSSVISWWNEAEKVTDATEVVEVVEVIEATKVFSCQEITQYVKCMLVFLEASHVIMSVEVIEATEFFRTI
jgi:hypothetical protein